MMKKKFKKVKIQIKKRNLKKQVIKLKNKLFQANEKKNQDNVNQLPKLNL